MLAGMRLKVMTYNLLYGFHERTGEGWVRREPRARAAAEVVRAEAPDVLALTEAAYCAPGGRLVRDDFAALFGLPHVACAGLDGDWACALVSRFPIRSAVAVALGGSPSGVRESGLRVVLDCDGRDVHVDVVHPSPHISEAERVAAFEPLLASVQAPHILTGDFNALSDEDPYTAAALVAQMRAFSVKDPEGVAAEMLDRQLIARVRAAGFVDTLQPGQRVHTIPTRLSRPHATQGAQLRIDYVFVSRDVRVLEACVVQRPPTDEASDHYPVTATLEL
jgi:endonuclease/exonuclease/phosphatase family metal-dependent hydrolase